MMNHGFFTASKLMMSGFLVVVGGILYGPPAQGFIQESPNLSPSAPLESRVVDAMKSALNDERKAQATYMAVIKKYGLRRPFVNILRAEKQHEKRLLALFQKYQLTVPADTWETREIPVPTTFSDCCRTGIQSEKENIAMYDGFLKFVHEPDIRQVFTVLRDASAKNHLPAFQRCAGERPEARAPASRE